MAKISPFDYLNAITKERRDLIRENGEETYSPFVINRAFSYHARCVMYANEINQHPHLDKIPQHDYYMNSLRKTNLPFVKWGKKAEAEGLIRFIMEVMSLSRDKAEDCFMLLPKETIAMLEKEMENRDAR